jgi:hypothetical protein
LNIRFTVGTAYERTAPLAEKNDTAGLSNFSVRGARGGILLSKERSTFTGHLDKLRRLRHAVLGLQKVFSCV